MEVRQRGPAYTSQNGDDESVSLLSSQVWSVAEKEAGKKAKHGLLDYHALPDYLKDNEYILSYYRADLSFSEALISLFRMHNETVNIWTHFLGFLLFLGLTVWAIIELWQVSNPLPMCFGGFNSTNSTSKLCLLQGIKQDVTQTIQPILNRATRWPFFVFLGGSMFCLLASTICHLFTCHSKPIAIFLMRVDYAGIAAMIATSFFPPIYYIFQCTPIWQWVYLSTISLLAVTAVGVLFAPSCQSSKYRPVRALLFLSMGVSGVIPAVHAVIENWNEPLCTLMVAYEAAMAGSYAIGTFFYVIRIPERWKPGIFDLGGHSHNIFHVLVIVGALIHYRAALLFLEWRDSKSCG